MGEKIKILGQINVQNATFEIELNHPPSSGKPNQIHIQSENFRMELDEQEFIRFACAVRLAKEKLRRLKQIQ